MEKGAEDDVYVPDAVIIRMLRVPVMDEEIDARGVGESLEEYPDDGPEIDALSDRRDKEQDRPPQHEIEHERSFGQTLKEENLEEDTCQRQSPDDAECRPSCHKLVFFDDAHAYRRVAGGNQDIDGAMVEDAERTFTRSLGFGPMIEARSQVHEQHADRKERSAESHLPVFGITEIDDDPRYA